MRDELARAPDLATLRGLLEAGPLATLDERSLALGREAALQVLAMTAVSPSPGLDGVLVVWRGVRLVRQVAALHGLRPGLLGTVRLLRRVAFDAAGVAATDVAVTTLADAVMTSPMAGGLVGTAAGSAVAARRMLRLARAASEACRIVPRA
nr:DUF697 domain-containing protein [Roseomonas acroporae]